LRRLLLGAAALAALAIALAAIGLALAHRAMRAERTPLPDESAIAAAIATDDPPVRLSIANTASQEMPRSSVLSAGQDPAPNERYVMSHPSFVLEWPDGRILLLDAGMTRAGASGFGRPLEWLGGARPIAPHGSAAEQLGDARARVRAIAFTHLHVDHVGGTVELCEGRSAPLAVLLNEAQDARPNFTTRPGRRVLADLPCARVERLSSEGIVPLPGFPGVAGIHAGGHTPGSEIYVAAVGKGADARRYVFTGDIVNALDGLAHDVPKPFLYRLLMVPEDDARQHELRVFLRSLVDAGYRPLVSHDELALAASGVPAWRSPNP